MEIKTCEEYVLAELEQIRKEKDALLEEIRKLKDDVTECLHHHHDDCCCDDDCSGDSDDNCEGDCCCKCNSCVTEDDEEDGGLQKIYQVIVVDPVWDNWSELGWYKSVADINAAIRDVIIDLLIDAVQMEAARCKGGPQGLLTDEAIEAGITAPFENNRNGWEEFFRKYANTDSFVSEYASTFSTAIDKPCLTYNDLVDECCEAPDGCGPIIQLSEIVGDESAISVRGFVHLMHPATIKAILAEYNTAEDPDVHEDSESTTARKKEK